MNTFTDAGGTGTVDVFTGAGCDWVASTTAAWVTITSGSFGTGSGTISYSVAANAGGTRSTVIAVTTDIETEHHTIIQTGICAKFGNVETGRPIPKSVWAAFPGVIVCDGDPVIPFSGYQEVFLTGGYNSYTRDFTLDNARIEISIGSISGDVNPGDMEFNFKLIDLGFAHSWFVTYFNYTRYIDSTAFDETGFPNHLLLADCPASDVWGYDGTAAIRGSCEV